MGDDLVRTRSPSGAEFVRTPEEAAALEARGERELSGTELALKSAAAGHEAQREAFDTTADGVLTFAEGVVDALSFGLIHDPSEQGDIRRDVHSGKALAGELLGFAVGMGGPGLGTVAKAGRKLGEKAAGAVLKDVSAGSRGAIAAKTAGGAAEMAGLMAAGSVGHQFTDAVLEDKDFSALAVVHEAGLGALLGGGFNFLSGVFSRAASRAEVRAQGGLLNSQSSAAAGLSDEVGKARKAWDGALETHEQRFGILRQLERDGLLDASVPEFMSAREVAIAEARSARATLDSMDFEKALAGNPREWSKWHNALEHYQSRLQNVDDLMTPRNLERMRAQAPGSPADVAGGMMGPRKLTGMGSTDEAGLALDDLMRDPARQADYQRLYGRPYEFLEREAGSAELGGVRSATSDLKTRPGTPRQPLQAGPRQLEPVAGPTGETAVSQTSSAVPEGRWSPSSPPGKFNMSEYSPGTLAGEGVGARVISRDNAVMPGGGFMPAADVRQNAEAFAQFRARAQTGAGGAPDLSKAVTPPAPIAPVEAGTKVIARGTPAPEAAVGSTSTTKVIPRGSTSTTKVIPRTAEAKAARTEEGKAAVRRYLDEWYATAEAQGPRYSPGDYAAQDIRRTVESLRTTAAGRDVSADALGMAAHLKLPTPKSALGAELNSLYALRHLSNAAADASTGAAMAGKSKSRILSWITRRAAGRIGSSIAGGMIGGTVGGPVGYFAGAALAYKYMGFSGRAAGASGRLYERSVKTAAALLSNGKATLVARASLGNRLAKNNPVVYSDRGPIEDPLERIQELQRVAQTPATVAELIANAAGDLNVISPDFVAATAAAVTAQLTFLLAQAPPLQYNRMGQVVRPSAGAVRRFLEAENAVFDLEGLLTAIEHGQATDVQIQAFQQAHGPVHMKTVAFMLSDPTKLAQLERSKLRTAERVLGLALSDASDPAFVARQQMGWAPEQLPGAGMPGAGPAQALKIPGTGGPPSDRTGSAYGSTPTPAQSYGTNGRAPGN